MSRGALSSGGGSSGRRSYPSEVDNVTDAGRFAMASRAVTTSQQHQTTGQLDGVTRVVKCTVDEDQCLSLQDILASFQTAINEEQAWALCYQTVKCFRQHYQASQCYLITEPAHLFLHKDGYVHQKSLFPRTNKSGEGKRHPVGTNSHKMFTSLGIVLFHALDYGLCEDDERPLSKPLELLIQRLTSAHEIARRHKRAHQQQQARSSRNQSQHQEMHSLGSFYDDDHLDEEDADEDEYDECANADEGIERDCHDESPRSSAQSNSHLVNFDQVLQMCVSRLSSRESADSHYKAVCRALLAETLELSTFLDQIAKGTKELRKSSVVAIGSHSSSGNESEATLEKLEFHDWARLWIQVIRELRYGVKLKKVSGEEDMIHNTEYELTPYEMLLDDIRSRRYKLKKVMINGDLPLRLRKDAHELILDFIRSRPPLVPVSKRVLKPPPPKEVTLYERLMDSIRQEHKLKPTPPKERLQPAYSFSANSTPRHRPVTLSTEDLSISRSTSGTPYSKLNKPASYSAKRKLIKANIKLNLNMDDDADEDEQLSVENFSASAVSETKRRHSARPMSAYFPSEKTKLEETVHSLGALEEGESRAQSMQPSMTNGVDGDQPTAKDTVDSENGKPQSNASIFELKRFSTRLFSRERRHSISGFDTKSLQQQNAPSDIIENLDFDEDVRNHVATIWESSELGKSLECLSLTLKEVQHIRSVLTKAEIESLGVTKSLKTDLENGKICFTCLKTRFTFWGPWATICKLCNRAICERCATKMHIPTEQFERVPIYMLSPTPSPPNEKTAGELFNWSKVETSSDAGGGASGGDSHSHSHKDTSESENEGESKSLPPKITFPRNRISSRIVRMLTLHHDSHLGDGQQQQQQQPSPGHSGPLVKVCRDCKTLVRHLIDTGRTNFGAGIQKQAK